MRRNLLCPLLLKCKEEHGDCPRYQDKGHLFCSLKPGDQEYAFNSTEDTYCRGDNTIAHEKGYADKSQYRNKYSAPSCFQKTDQYASQNDCSSFTLFTKAHGEPCVLNGDENDKGPYCKRENTHDVIGGGFEEEENNGKGGIGMPAFIGDKSYMAYLQEYGVPIEEARNYALAGCLDASLPGKSRVSAICMFIVPMILDITLHNGVFLKTGEQLGPKTGDAANFKTFEELFTAFKTQFAYFLGLNAEYNNLWIRVHSEAFPDPVRTALMDDPMKAGKNFLDRNYLLENAATLNMVGMINVADSLTVMKKLVFEDKEYTMREMLDTLAANWEGYDQMKKDCLAVPKFGNDNDYADFVATELFQWFSDTAKTFGTVFGGIHIPSAISISSQWPGGAQTGATPEGRCAGAVLADGSLSAVQGCGPTAIFKSAAKIKQDSFQATLMNMKFHPTALKSEEDIRKLASLIKTYFEMGGKHVQFNVVSRETLEKAKKAPEQNKDIVVRVAGYSAYFVKLTPPVQDEIIMRTEHQQSA